MQKYGSYSSEFHQVLIPKGGTQWVSGLSGHECKPYCLVPAGQCALFQGRVLRKTHRHLPVNPIPSGWEYKPQMRRSHKQTKIYNRLSSQCKPLGSTCVTFQRNHQNIKARIFFSSTPALPSMAVMVQLSNYIYNSGFPQC